MDLAVPADHRVKIKESEKIDKYLDLARELKKLWNMRVMMISIVVDALEMVLKVYEKKKKTGVIKNQRKNRNPLDRCIVKNCLECQEETTLTSVKDKQLTLVRKT